MRNIFSRACVLIVLCILGSTFNLNAQAKPDSLYTRDVLLSDLDSLKQTILKSHPSPFAFCGEDSFHQAFEEAASSIDSLMSIRDFSRVVAHLMEVMRDSHSTLEYGQIVELVFNDPKSYVIPFTVERKPAQSGFDNEFLVARDWEDVLPKGGKLLSINGMDVHDLYDIALSYSCTEGDAMEARYDLATTLLPNINALFNAPDSINEFVVVPFGSDSAATYHVRGYQKKEYIAKRKERSKLDINKWIDADFDKDNSLVYFKLSTFSPPNSRKLKKTVKQTFKKANKEGYDNIVIDLRYNGGGSSTWVEYLYSFMDEDGYNTPNNVIARNSELALARNKGMDLWISKFLVKIFYPKDEDIKSFQHFRSMPLGEMDTLYFHDKAFQKDKYVFKGNAYLLINSLSASASVDFTSSFYKKQRGEIIGVPCLGPLTGTWGNASRYQLPASKLKVSISTIRYNYDDTFEYLREPIQPHHILRPTAEDLNVERDTQLELVKTLIKQK
jgi:hypothetical protein